MAGSASIGHRDCDGEPGDRIRPGQREYDSRAAAGPSQFKFAADSPVAAPTIRVRAFAFTAAVSGPATTPRADGPRDLCILTFRVSSSRDDDLRASPELELDLSLAPGPPPPPGPTDETSEAGGT